MLRRTATLALLALPLTGCVTYEVVERRLYHEDGSYTRIDGPYDEGRRYDGRRYAYDDPRSLGGRHDDPYERWFYGWRGHGSAWALDPYFGFGSVRYGSRWGRGYRSPWYAYFPPWGYSSPWGYDAAWGYPPSWGYYAPSRPYHPHRPHPHPHPHPHIPRPEEARPMPKPVVLGIGPSVDTPVMQGPRVGGEPLRPSLPPRQGWEEPAPPEMLATPDVIARPKPLPVMVDEPRPYGRMGDEERRFERQIEMPREMPDYQNRDEPRFEPPEAERFEAPAEPVIEERLE